MSLVRGWNCTYIYMVQKEELEKANEERSGTLREEDQNPLNMHYREEAGM